MQTNEPSLGTPIPGDRLHTGHRGLLLAPMHFGLPGDRLYQLAQARPHNVLHFLVLLVLAYAKLDHSELNFLHMNSNIIPSHISSASLRLMHYSAELLLRVGLLHAM